MDRLTGGAGNDSYKIENAGDVVIEIVGGGSDLVQSSISWDMTANVENASLFGTAHVNIVGNGSLMP